MGTEVDLFKGEAGLSGLGLTCKLSHRHARFACAHTPFYEQMIIS